MPLCIYSIEGEGVSGEIEYAVDYCNDQDEFVISDKTCTDYMNAINIGGGFTP